MPELVFRTRECAQHGHPEFTLHFREPLLVPNLERGLMRFLEEGVARGTKFAAGEGEVVAPLDGSYLAALDDPETLR